MTVTQLEAQILNQLGFAGTAILSDLTPDMLLATLNQAASQICTDVPILHRVASIAMPQLISNCFKRYALID